MSGGSMNYMSMSAIHEPGKLIDGHELGYIDECMEMAIKSGVDEEFINMFACDIAKLDDSVSFIRNFAQKYEEVMHACEWHKSGDRSLETVKKECEKYLKDNQKNEPQG